MGDLQVWIPQPNGFLDEGRLFPSLSSSSSSNPHPLSIGGDSWLRAEQTTLEIICRIQPTEVSEQRRKDVIDYVQRLIKGYLGSEVFPFGSVPLKTYLPDGDIDLTALNSQNGEDTLASDVRAVLEGEEQSNAAEFQVKDVQFIYAEVKLVKCIIQNIVVDISFNQLGGLCTLCFLEQVDNLIGKDHLFKRSIILIKAWCYHESRILGAHHGLISTYALETLVLYIFHLFHASLNGPLTVLYRFLDYFSKFDWDNYCISLSGPVCLSSLPKLVAETPENGGGDLLLSEAFLRSCLEKFSVPSRGIETNSRVFPRKYLNIVDPLKENNNLGRSVSKANFYRIRSAFTYGARKLGRILSLPIESIADEVKRFFLNTLERHGGGQRPDVQDPIQDLDANVHIPVSSFSGIETFGEGNTVLESTHVDSSCIIGESKPDPREFLCEGINNIMIPSTERESSSGISSETPRHPMKVVSSLIESGADQSAIQNAVSGYRLAGDAKDLATFRIQDVGVADEISGASPSGRERGSSSLGRAHHAPHLYFRHTVLDNVETGNGNLEQSKPLHSGISENKVWCGVSRALDVESGSVSWQDSEENRANNKFYSYGNYETASAGSTDGLLMSCPVAYPSEDVRLSYREKDTAGNPQSVNSLSDLSGDYDNHPKGVLHGECCHESALNAPVLPIPPVSPSQFWNKNGWNNLRRPYKRFPHIDGNGVIPGSPFYHVNRPLISGAAFGVEEFPKQRGTGTYFPNMNHLSYRERQSPGRGRNHGPATYGHLQRPPRNNGQVATPPETSVDKGGYELSQAQFPDLPSRVKAGSSNIYQPSWPALRKSNAESSLQECDKLEFGSLGSLPLEVTSLEASRQPEFGATQAQGSVSTLPTSVTEMPKLESGMDQERVAVVSYHLKDEDDFPPLSPMKVVGRDHL